MPSQASNFMAIRVHSFRTVLLSVVALLLAGCASTRVDVDGEDPGVLRDFVTFAFDTGPIGITAEGLPVDDDGLETEVRRALSEQLKALGLVQAPEDEARLLVGTRLTTIESQKNFDPTFSPYVAIKEETGLLWVEAFDTEAKETVWRAHSSKRLRTSQQAKGIHRVRFEPTDEERHWCLYDLAEAIFSNRPTN